MFGATHLDRRSSAGLVRPDPTELDRIAVLLAPCSDSQRFVSLLDSERELARSPDEERRKNVYAQVQEHEAERARWFAGVQTSAVCVALLSWAWITPGTTVAELGACYGWAPWLLLAVAGMRWPVSRGVDRRLSRMGLARASRPAVQRAPSVLVRPATASRPAI